MSYQIIKASGLSYTFVIPLVDELPHLGDVVGFEDRQFGFDGNDFLLGRIRNEVLLFAVFLLGRGFGLNHDLLEDVLLPSPFGVLAFLFFEICLLQYDP